MLEGDFADYLTVSYLLKSVMADLVIILLLSIILIPSAIADYREEKIPNFFSMSGWVLGPLMHFFLSGAEGLLQSGLGFLLLFGLTFPLWALKWFGAADVKLIASVGAIVSGYQALTVLLGIALAGFVISVAVMIVRGNFLSLLRSLYFRFRWGIDDTGKDSLLVDASIKQTIPYAVPIAFGTLMTILYMHL